MSTLWHQSDTNGGWFCWTKDLLISLQDCHLQYPAVHFVEATKTGWQSPNFQWELSTALSFSMAGVKEMAFWPELLESSTCHTLYPLEQEMQNQRNGSFNRNSVRKKRHSKIRYHTYTHRHSSQSCLVEHASLQGWPDFIQGNSYERSMNQNAEAVACSRSRIVDCHRTCHLTSTQNVRFVGKFIWNSKTVGNLRPF